MTILLFRFAFYAYLLLLTILLLAQEPMAMLGFLPASEHVGGVGTHFLAFTILATLAVLSRVAHSFRVLLTSLVGYAILIETSQCLVPPRTVETLDYIENLAGIAVGLIVGRLALRIGPLKSLSTRA